MKSEARPKNKMGKINVRMASGGGLSTSRGHGPAPLGLLAQVHLRRVAAVDPRRDRALRPALRERLQLDGPPPLPVQVVLGQLLQLTKRGFAGPAGVLVHLAEEGRESGLRVALGLVLQEVPGAPEEVDELAEVEAPAAVDIEIPPCLYQPPHLHDLGPPYQRRLVGRLVPVARGRHCVAVQNEELELRVAAEKLVPLLLADLAAAVGVHGVEPLPEGEDVEAGPLDSVGVDGPPPLRGPLGAARRGRVPPGRGPPEAGRVDRRPPGRGPLGHGSVGLMPVVVAVEVPRRRPVLGVPDVRRGAWGSGCGRGPCRSTA
mmetsp:Transcript_61809/g.174163  ORF Transcript_61809/g.174163 Transcript_61809/m.174163 type:complete len:317 (+) Transcript_61809:162-1112(+)